MDINHIKFYIRGMTCLNCQMKIQKKLEQMKGVSDVKVSYDKSTAEIAYHSKEISVDTLKNAIEQMGYTVLSDEERKKKDFVRTIGLLAVIFLLYELLQSMGILNLLAPGRLADTKMGYGMLFIIGILTSVHCIAMCGGINLSQCLSMESFDKERKKGKLSVMMPAFTYNMGRVFSYTMIGFLLGAIGFLFGTGTKVGIPVWLQGMVKLVAGLFMIMMGINMLNLFPGLRKVKLPVPKWVISVIGRERAKSRRPFWIGVLNGFMPCGPLQAMWLVALASGSPAAGAFSMFSFSLGTVPLMLGLGSIVSALGKKFTDKAMTAGAILVTILGLAMLSQGSALSGFRIYNLLPEQKNEAVLSEAEIVDGEQIVNSSLSSGRYPEIQVQEGIPVRWIIDAPEGSINGCNYKIILRDYDIEYTFHEGENVIEFVPDKTGTIRYSCWMGMIHGTILVTDGEPSDEDMEAYQKSIQEEADNRFRMPCCGY